MVIRRAISLSSSWRRVAAAALQSGRWIALALALASFASGPVSAASYQISLGGSDANDGVTAPWRSLQKGIDALQPGDSLDIVEGEYQLDAALLVRGKKATESAPIVIQARGRAVLRDGADRIRGWQGAIDIRNSSWVTIRGFTILQSSFFGVYMQDSDHITVEECATNQTGASGVAAWTSSNIAIRNNDIRAGCNLGQRNKNGGCQEHISLDHVNGFLVEGNKVHDSPQSGKAHWGGGEGIDVKNGSSHGVVRNNEVWNLPELGLYVDAWQADIHDVEIYGNRVHHCANGIALNSERTGNLFDLRVHDNLSYANGTQGIGVWRMRETSLTNVQIYNNTVAGNGPASSKPYFVPEAEKIDRGFGIEIANPHTTGLIVRNNIIYGNLTAQLVVTPAITNPVIEHNLVGSPNDTGIAGNHPVKGDPMFVDAATFDFRLRSGSPAIDAGTGDSKPGAKDAWGNPRLFGKAVDIGAFEFPQPAK